MPNVLHRTTFEYRSSVDLSELPEPVGNYVVGPDLGPVAGEPSRYWILTGDVLSVMDAGAKAVVDAAIAAALVTANRTTVKATVDATDALAVEVRALIHLFNKRDNFNTNRIVELQDRVQAMLDSTGGVANMRTDGLAVSISATNTRPLVDAIQDYKDEIDAGAAD